MLADRAPNRILHPRQLEDLGHSLNKLRLLVFEQLLNLSLEILGGDFAGGRHLSELVAINVDGLGEILHVLGAFVDLKPEEVVDESGLELVEK